MNELMYSFRDNNVRVIMKDNEPWFVMNDICEVLEIKNPRDAFSRLEEHEKGVGNTDSYNSPINIINEYGLYSLVFTSRKPEAREFKNWVTRDILPSIRKNGIYATPQTVDKMLDDPQFIIDVLNKLKNEQELRKKAESTVTILTHVNKVYTTTEIAKELKMRSAISLNKKLNELGIQFYQNDTWVLYSKYADKGYTDIKQSVLDNGKVIYDRKWTQMGREFLLKLLAD